MCLAKNRDGVLSIMGVVRQRIEQYQVEEGLPGSFTIAIEGGGSWGAYNVTAGAETQACRWKVIFRSPDGTEKHKDIYEVMGGGDLAREYLRGLFQKRFGDRYDQPEFPYDYFTDVRPNATITIARGRNEIPKTRLIVIAGQNSSPAARALLETPFPGIGLSSPIMRRGSSMFNTVLNLLRAASKCPDVSVRKGGDEPEEIEPNYRNFIFGEARWQTDLRAFLDEVCRLDRFDYIMVDASSKPVLPGRSRLFLFYENPAILDFEKVVT